MALVERDSELNYFDRLLDDARNGSGGVVVFEGPIGSGKTALLNACAERGAADGARVLRATAAKTEEGNPLGVIRQILTPGAAVDDLAAEEGDPPHGSGRDAVPPMRAEQMITRAARNLYRELARANGTAPTVICIDDVQHADPLSADCLRRVLQRLRPARTILVLADAMSIRRVHPRLHADVQGLPHGRTFRLGPLSLDGVAQMLTGPLGTAAAERFAGPVYRVSGGSPLLVEALADDIRERARGGELVPGAAFASAVVNCLYRSEPAVLDLARMLAMASDDAPAATVVRLGDTYAESVDRGLAVLGAVGLTDAHGFRHPHARAAVLHDISSQERAALHARIAHALHGEGAGAAVVARHLIAAGRIDVAWAPAVLADAAARAESDGDLAFALRCLRRAWALPADEGQRAEISVLLTEAEWRADPLRAARSVSAMTPALPIARRHERLTAHGVFVLLWAGRVAAAKDLLRRSQGSRGAADIRRVRNGMPSHLYPGIRGEYAPPNFSALLLSALDDCALATIGLYLMARAERAEDCEPFLAEAAARRAPTWDAISESVRARMFLRTGDLPAAARHASTALTHLTPQSWGVVLGAPLSVLLLARTAMGGHADALSQFHLSAPDAAFQTPFGIQYLYARGTYFLSAGRPKAALNDFRICGMTMARWRIEELPDVPWRIGAAWASIELGRARQAEDLASEQLSQDGRGQGRARGGALRVIAALRDPFERPGLLRQAVDVLQETGDRLELAYAVADLSRAHRLLREHDRARAVHSWAYRLAEECGAEVLRRTLAADEADATSAGATVDLSDAEARVARLAAVGYSNREIADRLYVTVSTVEQHLTRVYRKLRIRRRTDLPALLGDALSPST